MPGRMSNKDRIAKLAAEKAAGSTEKSEAKKRAPAKRAPSARAAAAAAAKTGARMRLVWVVCDQAGNPVKSYPYPARADADAEVARLTASKGKPHFIKKDKEPMPVAPPAVE